MIHVTADIDRHRVLAVGVDIAQVAAVRTVPEEVFDTHCIPTDS